MEGEIPKMNETKDFLELVKKSISSLINITKSRKEVEYHIAEKHGVSKGELQRYYNNPDLLEEADMRLVAILGEQMSLKLGIDELQLERWFSEKEISDIHVYYKMENYDKLELPIVIENVTLLKGGRYVFPLDSRLIAKMYNSGILNYNTDIQRQPRITKRLGKVTRKPYVNPKSVKEITQHLLNGTLEPTNIVYNASVGSADSGEELFYDAKTRTLTINEGTRLDILDGMHRTLSCVETYRKNKEISFDFIGVIFNYTTKQAQQYQAQLAKANPIPKSRIQELEANRYADIVVQQLRLDSELKGRIASTDKFPKGTQELVSYGVLSNSIDATFSMKSKLEAIEVAKYLADYFMYLFGYFGEEMKKVEEGNLLFYNKMFIGHVELAKRMQDSNVPLTKLKDILGTIDFSRDNKLFEEYGIIINGKMANKIEKPIVKMFRDISIT